MADRDEAGERTGLLLGIGAVVIGLIGLASAAGGLWLVLLGGSFYYLVAGIAIVLTAALLWMRRPAALILFALVIFGTLAWAIGEIGFDWWQLVPRGDVIVIIGIFLLLPWVTRRLRRGPDQRPPAPWRGAGIPLALSLVAAAIVGGVAIASDLHDMPGRLPGPRAAVPADYGGVPDGDWHAYGRSSYGNRWSPLTQITPANADKLEVAWRFDTGDVAGPGDPTETTYELTPIKVGDTLYVCTPHDWVFALDAETGKVKWRFDPHIREVNTLQHLTCRGVSYHDGRVPGAPPSAAACQQRIFLPTADARLIALDALTGRPCADFGRNGAVNLWRGMPRVQPGYYYSTSPPVVTKDLVIIAGNVSDNVAVKMPSGVVRAYDVKTGRLVWNWDPGNPDETAPIGPGEHYSWSSPNSWTISAADEALGLIYVPMGNQPPDQWGGDRPPTTERVSSAIVALDIATGKERWVYQTVHHDLWDMDIGSQPSLIDLTLPDGTVPALVAPTKTGNLFVLDRRTGRPLFPTPERRVPGNAAPGDHVSPTQPFSPVSLMPTEPVRERDMWGATMFDQLACRITFRRLRYDGPFTPPSIQGSLVYPGNFGVFDWGGIAVDPVRQIAFTNPNYMAFVDKLLPRNPGESPAGQSKGEQGYNPNRGAPFAVLLNPFLSAIGLPCQAPPWGYVAGVDLVTGKTMWMHKNGTIQDESPIPVPIEMGVPALGGPVITAGGVGFLTSTLDYYIRAYDVTTGEELWRARLPAGGQATPMTYRSPASGRQFVIAVAGGHGSLGTKQGDSIIAYALPRGRPAA